MRGTVTRPGHQGAPPTVAQLAGDVDAEGLLNLDESMDGVAISGLWLGELQAASCGTQFKGTWRNSLENRFREAVARDAQVEMHLEADRATRYEAVAEAMSAARRAGLGKIGFVTQPGEAPGR